MAPRWPMMTRRWSKEGLSGPQDGLKMAQHRPLGQAGVNVGPFWGQFGANLVLFSAILVSTCTPEAKISVFPWFSNDFKVSFELLLGHVGSILAQLGATLDHFVALLGHLGALWVPHLLAKFVANRRRDARKGFSGLPCAILGSWVLRGFDIVPRWSQDCQKWPQNGQR